MLGALRNGIAFLDSTELLIEHVKKCTLSAAGIKKFWPIK
jgi:hypothetical protein